MDELRITPQDLIMAVLEKTDGDDDGFVTTTEMTERTGLYRDTITQRLRELMASGKLEMRRVRRDTLTGSSLLPAYRLKAQDEKGA